MRATALAFLCLAMGCGDDDAPPDLEGLWYFSSDTQACDFGVLFENGTYETDMVCRLENGAIGIEAEVGSFTSTDSQIVVMPEASSCAGDPTAPVTLNYDFVDGKLRLTTQFGVLIFERLERDNAVSGQFAYGCYDDDDGLFTPMPVKPL